MCKNKVIVISGVSGAGKTFLIDSLLNKMPSIKKLTTITTRPKRDDELGVKSKKFVDKETFNKMLNLKKLFVVNTVFGFEYAFDMKEFETKTKKSHLILELKLEDIHQIKEIYEPVFSIYIRPEKPETAIKNINNRNTFYERLEDINHELNNLENKSLPNFQLIDTVFCNRYDDSSIDDFIITIKKVLNNVN